MGKRQPFQQALLGNLDSYMQINETRTHPHTMHNNKLKMAERLKYKTRHHQAPEREHRQNTLSSRSLMGSCLVFRSFIHFEFIFVCGVRVCSSFIDLLAAVQVSSNTC